MSRYDSLLGRRVRITYRDGEVRLFAVGKLVAVSGEYVVLEAKEPISGSSLGWKIPHNAIISVIQTEGTSDKAPNAASEPYFRRRGRRLSTRKPVVMSWQDEGIECAVATFTLMLSRFGCALRSQKFFQPGKSIRIEYEGRIMEGRVVYSLKDHSTERIEVGVAFDRDAAEFWQIGF